MPDAVAAGRENYYSGAVAAGEPPGVWYGVGAGPFGLSGLVDTQDATALNGPFVDLRDSGSAQPVEPTIVRGTYGRPRMSSDPCGTGWQGRGGTG